MAEVSVRFKGDSRSAVSVSRDVESAIGRVETSARKADSATVSFAKTLGSRAIIGAAAGVTALGAAVGVTGLKFDAMREQAQIAFTTMLGSGAKARAFLGELAAFAAKTPFEFPDLVSASQKLLAMGFAAKDVIPTLTDIGDAVAGLGGGKEQIDQVTRAMGQMQAKGKAAGDELLQLTEVGIPALRYIAEAIGKTTAETSKLISKGAVDAQTAIAAVRAGMQRDFGGLMEQQSQSVKGLLSSLKDYFQQISGTIMAPLFERIRKGMKEVVDALGDPAVRAEVDRVAKAIGQGIGDAVDRVVRFVRQNWPAIQGAFQASREAADLLLSAISGILGVLDLVQGRVGGWKEMWIGALAAIGAAWTALKVKALIETATIVAVNEAGARTVSFAWKTALASTGIGLLAVAVGIAVELIIRHFEDVKKFATGLWAGVKAAWETAWKLLQGVVQLGIYAILSQFKLLLEGADFAFGWLPGIGGKIKAGLDKAEEFIDGFRVRGTKLLQDAGGEMMGAWRDATTGQVKGAVIDWEREILAGLGRISKQVNAATSGLGATSAAESRRSITTTRGVATAPSSWASPGAGHAGGRTSGMSADWYAAAFGPADLFGVFATPGTLVGAPVDGVLLSYTVKGASDPGGDALKFKGDDGYTYFMAHVTRPGNIQFPAPGQRVRKGTPLAAIDANARPHLHIDKAKTVQLQAAGAAMPPRPTATTPDLSGAVRNTAAAAKATGPKPADEAEVTATMGLLRFIGQAIPRSLDTTEPELRKRLDAIRATVKRFAKDGVITGDELQQIKGKLESLNAALARGIRADEIRGSLAQAREDISRLFQGGFITEQMRDGLKAQIDKVAKLIRQATDPKSPGGVMITDQELARIEKRWGEASGAIKAGLAEMAAAAAGVKDAGRLLRQGLKDGFLSDTDVEAILERLQGLKGRVVEQVRAAAQAVLDQRARAKDAWDKFFALALEAFDAARAKLREALNAQFDELTASEQALADLRKQNAEAEFAQRKRAAEEALALAKQTGEGLVEAQRAYDEILMQERLAGLEAQAQTERSAREAERAAKTAAFDEETKLLRGKFEAQLLTIQEGMANGKIGYDEGLAAIRKLFADYQVPFEEKSSALGQALQGALLAAFETLKTELGRLASAIEDLADRISGKARQAEADRDRILRAYAEANPPTSGNPLQRRAGQAFAAGGIVGLPYAGRAQNGMLVPGTYTPTDPLVVRVSRGEAILNPRQLATLWGLLNGGGGGAGGAARPVENHFHFDRFVGSRQDMRQEVLNTLRDYVRATGFDPLTGEPVQRLGRV